MAWGQCTETGHGQTRLEQLLLCILWGRRDNSTIGLARPDSITAITFQTTRHSKGNDRTAVVALQLFSKVTKPIDVHQHGMAAQIAARSK